MAALVAVVALLAGGFAAARLTDDDSPSATGPRTTQVTTGSGTGSGTSAGSGTGANTATTIDADATDEPIAAVAAALAPSVVQIETRSGLGSGVVYDDQGHVLTAAHVLEGAGQTVQVRLADGTTRTGQVLGADDATDIGVVQITGDDLPAPAALALDSEPIVGQIAVAIGSPFGLDQTVTSGIVSAVGRAVETPGGAIDMIQTDAPINPGNSGGVLANKKGQVIGINDQIATATGENTGVGFAVPITIAKAVADKLVAGEPVEFAFLGVSSQSAAQSSSGDEGAVVVQVTPGTAAAAAGVVEGDRIVAVDGRSVRTPVELGATVRSKRPGDVVTLTIVRNGVEQDLQVTLGSTKDR